MCDGIGYMVGHPSPQDTGPAILIPATGGARLIQSHSLARFSSN